MNYRIYTDAIKDNLLPPRIDKSADVLCICVRGGYAERGAVRENSKGVARGVSEE